MLRPSNKFCLRGSNNLENNVNHLSGVVPSDAAQRNSFCDDASLPPGDLVGEDVLIVQQVATYRLQLSNVAVERVTTNIVQLFQDFLLDMRSNLNILIRL